MMNGCPVLMVWVVFSFGFFVLDEVYLSHSVCTAQRTSVLNGYSFTAPTPSAVSSSADSGSGIRIKADLRMSLLDVLRVGGGAGNVSLVTCQGSTSNSPSSCDRFEPTPAALALTSLVGSDFALGSEIPPIVGRFVQLERLELHGGLMGAIPSQLQSLKQLKYLSLISLPGEYIVVGSARAGVGVGAGAGGSSSSGRKRAEAVRVALVGSLPEWLGDMPALEHLTLISHELTGTIPVAWSRLSSTLRHFQLSACLARIHGHCAYYHTTPNGAIDDDSAGSADGGGLINVFEGGLKGTLPPFLSTMTLLEVLNLGGHNWYGTLPDLHRLHRLRVLVLTGNYLQWQRHFGGDDGATKTAAISASLSPGEQLPGLTGVLPEWTNFAHISTIRFDYNRLSGPLHDFDHLKHTNLRYLTVSHNRLTGTLPSLLNLPIITGEIILGLSRDPKSGRTTVKTAPYYTDCHIDISNNRFRGSMVMEWLYSPAITLTYHGNALCNPWPVYYDDLYIISSVQIYQPNDEFIAALTRDRDFADAVANVPGFLDRINRYRKMFFHIRRTQRIQTVYKSIREIYLPCREFPHEGGPEISTSSFWNRYDYYSPLHWLKGLPEKWSSLASTPTCIALGNSDLCACVNMYNNRTSARCNEIMTTSTSQEFVARFFSTRPSTLPERAYEWKENPNYVLLQALHRSGIIADTVCNQEGDIVACQPYGITQVWQECSNNGTAATLAGTSICARKQVRLSSLTRIDLSSIAATATSPSVAKSHTQLLTKLMVLLPRLRQLETLILTGLNFQGALPAAIPQSLRHLDLRRNRFSGALPSSWNGMRILRYVDVRGNDDVVSSTLLDPEFVMYDQLERVAVKKRHLSCPTIKLVQRLFRGTLKIAPSYHKFADCYCDAGYSGVMGHCQSCLPGRYSDNRYIWKTQLWLNDAQRMRIELGTNTTYIAKIECQTCGLGRYQSQAGESACSACSSGRFSNVTGLSRCFDCPAGKYQSNQDGTICYTCPTGRFGSSSVDDGAEKSDVGSVISRTGANRCTVCPPGRSTEGRDGAVSCTPCDIGYASGYDAVTGEDFSGMPQCQICSLQTYANTTGQARCWRCPRNADNNDNNRPTSCICNAGFYMVHPRHLQYVARLVSTGASTRSSENVEAEESIIAYRDSLAAGLSVCMRCPEGADCRRGGATFENVTALAGYRASSAVRLDGNVAYFRCPNRDLCDGSGACPVGYEDPLCQVCGRGFARSAVSSTCSECPSRFVSLLLVVLGLFGTGVVAVVVVKLNVRSAKQAAAGEDSEYASGGLLKIFINFVQFNSFAAGLRFQWPVALRGVMSFQEYLSSASTAMLSLDCLVNAGRGGAGGFGTTVASAVFVNASVALVMPAVMIAFVWVAYAYWYRSQLQSQSQSQRGENRSKSLKLDDAASASSAEKLRGSAAARREMAILAVLFLSHSGICRRVLDLFPCIVTDLSGDLYLGADLRERCFEGAHLRVVLLVGLPALALWVVGIPVYAVWRLRQHRGQLATSVLRSSRLVSKADANVAMRFAFLVQGYKPEYYYWEGVVMIRKVVLVVLAATMSSFIHTQSLFVLLLLGVSLQVQSMWQPFHSLLLNRFETLSLSCSSLVFFFAQFLLVDDNDSDGGGGSGSGSGSGDAAVVCSVLIFAIWLLYVLLWVVLMFRALSRTVDASSVHANIQAGVQRIRESLGYRGDKGGGRGTKGGRGAFAAASTAGDSSDFIVAHAVDLNRQSGDGNDMEVVTEDETTPSDSGVELQSMLYAPKRKHTKTASGGSCSSAADRENRQVSPVVRYSMSLHRQNNSIDSLVEKMADGSEREIVEDWDEEEDDDDGQDEGDVGGGYGAGEALEALKAMEKTML